MRKIYSIALIFICLVTNAQVVTTTPTDSSTEVGVTEGQLSVSLTGAASYIIPFAVPPGINGVEPKIGLSYNSNNGSGNAGYGWNITGLSSITRIPSTKYHDNVNDPVDFDALDRFALDGQRLIIKTGTTGVYGANNTVYETEVFSNLKITYTSGTNSSYFTVQYPDGSVAQYGNSTDSKSITTWAINYWQNAQGIRINYFYNLLDNNLFISSIKYGSIGAAPTLNEILFTYINRTCAEQGYIAGQNIENKKIVSNVQVKGNGISLRNYFLEYTTNEFQRQLLTKFYEKNGDNSVSYNPTIFDYSNNYPSISNNYSTSLSLTTPNVDYKIISGDYNGDGNTDFMYFNKSVLNYYGTFNIYKNLQTNITNAPITLDIGASGGDIVESFNSNQLTGNTTAGLKYKNGWSFIQKTSCGGLFSVECHTIKSYYLDNNENVFLNDTKTFTNINNSCTNNTSAKFISGDFNGDGFTDMLGFSIKKNTFNGCTNKGIFFIDLKKDITTNYTINLGQLPEIDGGFITNPNNEITSETRIEVADFNGDGKSDFFIIQDGYARVFTLSPTGNSLVQFGATIGVNVSQETFLGDFNGDGKTDLVNSNSNQDLWKFHISTGLAFTSFSKSIGLVYDTNSSTRVDYEYLGIPYFDGPNTLIKKKYYATGSTYLVKDLNGDGKSEILCQRTRINGPILYRYKIDCVFNPIVGSPLPNGFCYSPWIENNDLVGTKSTVLNKQWSPKSVTSTDINFIPEDSNFYNVSYSKFLDINENPATSEIIYANNNSISIQKRNFKKENVLTKITTGNGSTEKIEYKPYNIQATIDSGLSLPQSTIGTENYPNVDLKTIPNLIVVSKLEKQSATTNKKRFYLYSEPVVNMAGLGFLGFKTTLATDWFENAFNSDVLYNYSFSNIGLRGAITSKFTTTQRREIISAININQSTQLYNTPTEAILSNKVFKLKLLESQELDNINNTSVKTEYLDYNVYNQPTRLIATTKNALVVEKTDTSNIVYEHFPTATKYIIGRPKSKLLSTIIYPNQPNEDATWSEELYAYDTNYLLSQTKTKVGNSGITSNDIIEDNIYDLYGNLTKKKTTAAWLTPRETNYEFGSAYNYRFLTKSKDIDGLETEYTYNSATGALLTEKLPSNPSFDLKTTYTYDTWGKKINTLNYLGNNQTISYAKQNEKTLVTTTKIAADGDSVSNVLLDDLGRKIKTGSKTLNGEISYVDYEYDNFDRIIKVSEPHFTSKTPIWNQTSYDQFGRVIQTITAAGKTTTVTYTGLTSAVNDGTQTKTTTKNTMGNVVTLTDAPGGTINYTYFANDNLKTSTFNGATTTIVQDSWGRKKELTDPSAGTYKYTYNDFGEITKEETPKGFTEYTYTDTGKLLTKSIKDAATPTNTSITSTYDYHPTTKILSSITVVNPYDGNNTFTYGYDNFKRLTSTVEQYTTIQPRTFGKTLTFDAYGRIQTETVTATAFGKSSTKIIFSAYSNGQLVKTYDGATATGTPLWETSTQNARGQVTTGLYGNGIAATNGYDGFGFPNTMTHSKTVNGTATNLMQLTNVFDTVKGNLTSRNNNLFAWNETFTYDATDRLTQFNNSLGQATTQEYEDDGKIKLNNLGTYKYTNAAKPFMNTSVTSLSQAGFDYYNSTQNRNQNITYNAFSSPIDISQFNEIVSLGYNAMQDRTVMYYGNAVSDKNLRPFRKFYSGDGSVEIIYTLAKTVNGVTTPEKVEFFTYIGGDAYSAPVVARKIDSGNAENFYLHRDYQGSIFAITNSTGDIIEKRLYDAWGEILKVQDGAGTTLPRLTFFDRGYTGHEHLQSVALINMNGRIYDAKLHRFLQPDENIQAPFNTQSYNRYGYVLNNPLKYTDPSGESWLDALIFLGQAILYNYVATAQATGQANPTKWDAPTWQNFGLGVGSLATSYTASNYFNNYVDHYNDKPNLDEAINSGNEHPFVDETGFGDGQKQKQNKLTRVINTTEEAFDHYYNGFQGEKGVSAVIGDETVNELVNSTKFQEKYNRIVKGIGNGQVTSKRGSFAVDLTTKTFHAGRTNVDYNVKVLSNGKMNVTLNLFVRDGFWDPNEIFEKLGIQAADGMGPNLEFNGGTPYYYNTKILNYNNLINPGYK